MENIIQFAFNIFNLGIFWFYLKSFKGMKNIPGIIKNVIVVALALVWTGINALKIPQLNIITLFAVLWIMAQMFYGSIISKIVMCISFVGIGIIIEPIGYVLMQMMIKNDVIAEDTLYYLMAFFVEFIRGNIFFLLNKLYGKNRISLKAIPKEVIHIMLVLPVFLIMICCLIIDISIEANNSKSFGLCIAAIISVTLSYYLILFVMERFTMIMAKRHEEERYLDELQFKQQFYHEIQNKYEYIQDLKHNFKNQFLECTAYLENNEIDKLKERIAEANHELEQMDEDMYSCNPILNSILRVKIGLAKKEKITCSIEMMIPADFNMKYGDMGILYGNLLDNAIEACNYVEPDDRFIRMKSKMMNGNLIISVINSKQEKRNVALVTTKPDKENHGRGVKSIRKVVDKYDGTIEFEDKGDTFEVTGILYEVG